MMAITSLPPSKARRENPLNTSSIAVPTAIAAFVGYTEKSVDQGKSLQMKPVRTRSFRQYVDYFGGPYALSKEDMTLPLHAHTDPLTSSVKILKTFYLYEGVRQFYENGGEECYILSVGDYSGQVLLGAGSAAQPDGLSGGLKQLEYLDRPTLLAIPDAVLLPQTDYYTLIEQGLAHCKRMGNRFFIIDLPEKDNTPESWIHTVCDFQDRISRTDLDYGAVYTPWLYSTRPLVLSATLAKKSVTAKDGVSVSRKDKESRGNDGSPAPLHKSTTNWKKALSRTPPSGSVLGQFVASDKIRGVWKTPSGIPLKGVSRPCVAISAERQGLLTGEIPINAIRYFTGKGTLLWGFRTLDGVFPDGYYIPTKRLWLLVERSLQLMMARFARCPNEQTTWSSAQNQALAYLQDLWTAGAFAGNQPQLAYYVHIGLGKTITAQDRLSGRMRLEAGIAPLRPGEFIPIQITQQLRPV